MIYFAQINKSGPIKIGHSKNVEKRLRDIQRLNPYPIKLIATQEGNFRKERFIHSLFYEERIGSSEWFRPGRRLLEYINKIKRSL